MDRILLIEDNLEIRENTAEMLSLYGYDVTTAENGTIGLEIARQIIPDLILCDIMMPGTDGYGVFHGLKAHGPTSHIPFIFVTASVEKRDIQAGLELGANGYIRKPFEIEDLIAEVVRCLNGRSA